VIDGQVDRIRRCISCEHCIDSMQSHDNLSCAVNPYSGREFERELKLRSVGKKIVVIGAGTAGLEAARQAATAGHRVTLLEQQKTLGGSLLLAATVHGDNERFLTWLLAEIKRLPITIKTGTRADINLVKALDPDHVIMATGARVEVPPIPGIGAQGVLTGAMLRQFLLGSGDELSRLSQWQRSLLGVIAPLAQRFLNPSRLRSLSRLWMPLGSTVVIVGADLVAVELAEFLAHRNRKVYLLDSGRRLAAEVGKKRRNEHMDRLDRLDVIVNTGVKIERITRESVQFSINGRQRSIEAGSIIVAGQPVPETTLAKSLEQAGFDVHNVGDMNGLGLIAGATRSATEVVGVKTLRQRVRKSMAGMYGS